MNLIVSRLLESADFEDQLDHTHHLIDASTFLPGRKHSALSTQIVSNVRIKKALPLNTEITAKRKGRFWCLKMEEWDLSHNIWDLSHYPYFRKVGGHSQKSISKMKSWFLKYWICAICPDEVGLNFGTSKTTQPFRIRLSRFFILRIVMYGNAPASKKNKLLE